MTPSVLDRGDAVPTDEDAASGSSADLLGVAAGQAVPSRRDFQGFPCIPSLSQHPFRAMAWVVRASLGLVFLVGLLAIAASIPFVNVFALGYLMETQGRVARSGKFRSAFYLLPAVQRLGGILLAVWLWLLPIRFLADTTRDSWLLAPGQTGAWLWTSSLIVTSVLLAVHMLLAIGCGGSFWRFLRPVNNARRLRAHIRSGGYCRNANDAVCEFVTAFRLPHLFRLGLLGYAAAYVWLVIPTLLFTMLEDVTSRGQIFGFLAGCVTLTATLLWLPLLLAHVSAEARFGAIFEFARVRKLAGQTPFRWAVATAILFACSSVPLLYTALFKIRIPPHDARWDLMVVFLLTVVPARELIGWVYHRATQRTRSAPSWPWRVWQWTNGATLCAGVGFYVYFLNLAATGGELGERSIWQFHSLLLPFPF
ncbi:MAG: hypothetical protein CMJ64_15595 [Planctomycetaceae bacterium]|nr:hypothetical protein [Planctomycetaceae bacterium]